MLGFNFNPVPEGHRLPHYPAGEPQQWLEQLVDSLEPLAKILDKTGWEGKDSARHLRYAKEELLSGDITGGLQTIVALYHRDSYLEQVGYKTNYHTQSVSEADAKLNKLLSAVYNWAWALGREYDRQKYERES